MILFKRKKNIESVPEGGTEEKEEEQKMATTLEQVRKAYEDLSEDDKRSFHQSIADRVHESIAAQERAEGNEDSQSAEDREHEALGAEHADWKRFDDFDARLKKIEEAFEARRENEKIDARETDDDDKNALDMAHEKYGLSSKFIGDVDKNGDGDISPKEIASILRNLKR